jgi:prepilin-type N-terminal cleavage/methylation domain-containing protein
MKKHFRFGFTLVELLVVISIISMLAAMLLPAVNAAREAGRRATCMNNQSQLALACINYDSAKQTLPPMRGEIGRIETSAGSSATISTVRLNVTSWVGFVLPYMEFNQLYQNLREVTAVNSTNYEGQLIRIKSLLCPSADIPEINTGTHYICNGGYQNAYATSWGGNFARATMSIAKSTGWANRPFDPGKLSDAVFFDHRAGTNEQATAAGSPSYACTTKCSVDYISSHGGTSNVLLLSENERQNTGNIADTADGARTGATWAFWRGGTTSGDPSVDSDGEDNIAFCFPIDRKNYSTLALINTSPPPQTLVSNDGTDGNYRSYDQVANDDSKKNALTPLFVNQGRGNTTFTYGNYRRARPSSNHPGIVVAAFADRNVRPLNENMDKKIFIWLCQPNSGQVVSGDSF